MPVCNGLSDYQQGILSEMGIPRFYQVSGKPDKPLTSAQPAWLQDLMALCAVDSTASLPPNMADYVSQWNDQGCLTVEQKRLLWQSLCATGYTFSND